MNPALDPLTPATARLLFRLGWDTANIAKAYGLPEAEVANMLAIACDTAHAARAAEDAAFAAVGVQ